MTGLTLIAGSAHPALADAVADELGVAPVRRAVQRFPDGELQVDLDVDVRGHDVCIVQPTGAPVAEHLFELLLLADAAHRAGAARIVAVVPYLGYARQDHRVRGREALGGRVVADMFGAAPVDGIVTLDMHAPALEGFFPVPVEHLSAVPALAAELRQLVSGPAVLVAPDLGAVRLAEQYATLLDLPTATVVKSRLSATEVRVSRIVGDVRGRTPVIVDDMISTGGTIQAAVEALLNAGSAPSVLVAATHGLFVGPAAERLSAAGPARILVTDSLPPTLLGEVPVQAVPIGTVLAGAIRRLRGEAA